MSRSNILILTLTTILAVVFAGTIPVENPNSNEQDMTILNEVVDPMEKEVYRNKLKEVNIKPLPAQEFKCLMYTNRPCTKEMEEIKGLIIQALTENCVRCSTEQKEKVGRVIAAMMAHDQTTWKVLLSRYNNDSDFRK